MEFTERNDLPFWTCPHCNSEVEHSEYYDVKEGDEWICPNCEGICYVNFVDPRIYVTIGTEKEG